MLIVLPLPWRRLEQPVETSATLHFELVFENHCLNNKANWEYISLCTYIGVFGKLIPYIGWFSWGTSFFWLFVAGNQSPVKLSLTVNTSYMYMVFVSEQNQRATAAQYCNAIVNTSVKIKPHKEYLLNSMTKIWQKRQPLETSDL